MKKTTALLLSLLMVVSLFTCLGTTEVSADDTIPSVIIQDFEGITYLDSGTQRNPDGQGALNSHGELVTDGDNSFLRVPNSGKWVRYLNNNKENSVLDDSATYHVSFKYRVSNDGYASPNGRYARVFFWWHSKNGSTADTNEADSPVSEKNGVRLRYDSDEETWRTATIYNLPLVKDAGDKYIQLQIIGENGKNATDDPKERFQIDLDDFVFTKATSAVAEVENNGTDFVNVNTTKPLYGETVTYTATEKADNTFLGWYDANGTKVSDKLVYSFIYDGTQAVALTAKFSAIVQDFEKGFEKNSDTSLKHDPDSKGSANIMYSSVAKNDSTTYVNIWDLSGGKSVQYVTNEKETGLLSAGKTYNVSFRYRLHKGEATATNTAVKVYLAKPSNATGSYATINYQADETTWKIATIKNVTIPAEDDGYHRFFMSGGNTGMSIDIDDIAFVEAKTGDVSYEGNGTATVNNTNPAFGETVTYTATEKSANNFYGWFDADGNVASTDATYSFTYTSKQDLVYKARFLNSAVQDFEQNFTVGATAPKHNPDNIAAADKQMWDSTVCGTVNENIYLNVKNVNAGKWIYSLTNTAETGRLKANTEYNLTFKYRIHKDATNDGKKWVGVALHPIDETTTYKSENNGLYGATTATGVNLLWLPYNADEETWQTATINNLYRYDDTYTNVGVLKAQISSEVEGYTIDLDDFVFTEVIDDTTSKDVAKGFEAKNMGFDGTAIRAQSETKAQAVRFKHTIDRSELDEKGYLGYELVEYGFVVASAERLNANGEELTLESETPHNTGVAYKKGETDKRFANLGDGKIQFTAAISGIGVQNYGKKLTLRVYINIKNGTNTVTLYSNPQSYSVYDVMWAVELYGTEAEQEVVQKLLLEDTTIADGFAEYKANNEVE